MNFCATCGMPLKDPQGIGLQNTHYVFCNYCIDEEQKVKPCEVIFEGSINYFVSAEKFSRDYAVKLTRKIMTSLPYWKDKNHTCLEGEMLSDEEFKRLFCEEKNKSL